jgi:hypothetical protein
MPRGEIFCGPGDGSEDPVAPVGPLYGPLADWFGLHETPELLDEIAYGWRTVVRRTP